MLFKNFKYDSALYEALDNVVRHTVQELVRPPTHPSAGRLDRLHNSELSVNPQLH